MSRLLPASGRARRFGDDIRTEQILAARHGRAARSGVPLSTYLFHSVDPAFAASVRAGDILVAGRHFGIGPGAELRVRVLLDAGIRIVVAHGFCRGFIRSALNDGLLAFTCVTDGIVEGDAVSLCDNGATGSVELRTPRHAVHCEPLAPLARALLEAGGLVPYLRMHGSFGPSLPGEQRT